MVQTERVTIDLPPELAAYLRDRARPGDLATGDAVVVEALRALQQRDAMEDQLRHMVAQSDADPRPMLTEAEVEAHFRAKWSDGPVDAPAVL